MGSENILVVVNVFFSQTKSIQSRRIHFFKSCWKQNKFFSDLFFLLNNKDYFQAEVNIFQNSSRIIGEKFTHFLGSGEELDEIKSRICFCDLGWGSVNYMKGNFSECKEE